MKLLPAIDLMGGEVVRLERGDPAHRTVYSNDPVAWAKKWEEAGADWLHLVDLDAAFEGSPRNLALIEKICSSVNIPCELGGGMRHPGNVSAAFSAGVSRVVLGTRACRDPESIAALCVEFGGNRIAVGIDSRNGFVAVEGWTRTTSLRATDLALQARQLGSQTIIATDIATDGMMTGPNFPALSELAGLLGSGLIASGGISSVSDLEELAGIPGIDGAIIGKALYDNKIPLPFPRFSTPPRQPAQPPS